MSKKLTKEEREALLGIYRGLAYLRRARMFSRLETVYALQKRDVTYIEEQVQALERDAESE